MCKFATATSQNVFDETRTNADPARPGKVPKKTRCGTMAHESEPGMATSPQRDMRAGRKALWPQVRGARQRNPLSWRQGSRAVRPNILSLAPGACRKYDGDN